MNQAENNSSFSFLQKVEGGVLLHVHLAPRAGKTKLGGIHNNRLKAYVTAAPVDGKANKALIELLSEALSIPKRNISIIRGDTSKDKTLHITGGQNYNWSRFLS